MTRMEQVVRVGLPASTNDTTWAAEHIEIKDSIATIDRTSWNQLCKPHQFCSHEYMAALEASGLECQYLYALAISNGELVGAAVATLWRIHLPYGMSLRVTTLGTPVNTGLPLMLAVTANSISLRYGLVAALERASIKRGVRLFVGRDFPTSDYLHKQALDKLYSCAHLELPWTDFEQYLEQHPKRKSIRRDLRSLEKAGYCLDIREGQALSTDEAQRLHALWLQLYRKHHSPDQIMVTEDFFLQMSQLDHAVWLLLRKEGRIDAFDLCFVLGDHLESTYCGVDLEVTSRLSIHRAMGYHIVRHAIGKGLRSINFGISNEQGKVEMGCRLQACYAWMQANPKWLGRLLRMILHRFVLKHDQDKLAQENLTVEDQR